MIKILKGKKFGFENVASFRFEFRDHYLVIDNLQKENDEPFEGCKLVLTDVLILNEWLSNVLKQNEQCDDCYNFEIPAQFKGALSCTTCGVSKVNE
jgi:hypothetical protein